MPFLRVNGWALPIADGSASEEHEIGGDFSRTFTGSRFSDERYDKRIWKGTTVPVTELVGEAIKGAVRGLGQLWPFNTDLYSSKGLAASPTVGTLHIGTPSDGSGDAVVDADGEFIGKFTGKGALGPHGAFTNILAADQRDCESTTGFTALGTGSFALDAATHLQGSNSIKVTCAATSDGVRFDATSISSSTEYTASVFVRPTSAETIRITLRGDVSGSIASSDVACAAGEWTLISVTGTTGGSDATALVDVTSRTGAAVFYVDQGQLVASGLVLPWVDGAGSALDIRYSPTKWLTNATDLTLSCWVKLNGATASDNQTLIYVADAAANSLFLLNIPSGTDTLRFETLGVLDDLDHASAFDTEWHLCTAVVRQNKETGEATKELFLDGASVGTSNPASMPKLSDITLIEVGHLNSGSIANQCRIADVQVLPYAAPVAQILAWYNMGKAMSALSKVYVDGDAMPDNTLTVEAEGDARESGYTGAHKDSAFRENLRSIAVELWEI